LCSLACPVAFDVRSGEGGEEVLTDYVVSDPWTQGRLCFRGHYLADMAANPFRLTEARLRAREAEEPGAFVSTEEGVAELASRLGDAGGRAAIIVDGNLPTEEVSAVLGFARDCIGTGLFSIHLPESDLAMLAGIEPGAAMLSLEDAAECDVFLAVGDVFMTHPVVSRPILELRAARKARVVGIDCMPNSVAGFAERFVRVKPGGEAAALAAVARLSRHDIPDTQRWAAGRSAEELAAMAGSDVATLRAVAEVLSGGKRAAILLDPVAGRMANTAAAASAASGLCTGPDMRLMPMFRAGNAVGAARAAAACGAMPLAEVVQAAIDGKVEALFLVGADLLRELPRDEAAKLRNRVVTLAAASAFRSRSSESADIVLPLATWFEMEGGIFDAAGVRRRLMALLRGPGAAMTAAELCGRVASVAGRALPEAAETPVGEVFGGAAVDSLVLDEAPEEAIRLVARSDVPDFDCGSISRMLSWPMRVEPAPEIRMNAGDASARGLADNSRVVVRANGHEAHARLRVREETPPGMAAISSAFVETRPLFRRLSYGAGGAELTWSETEVFSENEP